MAFSNKFDDANSHELAEHGTGPLRGLLLLAALAAAVFWPRLLTGSSGIGVGRALAALAGSGDETTRSVLIAVRLRGAGRRSASGASWRCAACCCRPCSAIRIADPYVLGSRAAPPSAPCSP